MGSIRVFRREKREMKKLILYGDSNTYGYDPRGMMGGRFPGEVRWTSVVAAGLTDHLVIEEGLNGRQLPVSRSGRISRFLENMVADLKPEDTVMMMLGTNDVLLTQDPDADVPIEKMRVLLDWYKARRNDFSFIVTAPVVIADINDEMTPYHRESLRMNREFEALCEKAGVAFIDTAPWNTGMAYDGVHIAEESQRQFGENMLRALMIILKRESV